MSSSGSITVDSGAARVNRLCEVFLSGLPVEQYRRAKVEGKRYAIAISRRGTPESPNPGGVKYYVTGGLTARDLIALEQKERSDGAFIEALRLALLEGRDVFVAQKSIHDEEIARRVEQEVRRILKASGLLPEVVLKQEPVAAPEPEPEPEPDPIEPTVPQIEIPVSEFETVSRLAQSLGYHIPTLRHPRDPRKVDGRWMHHFEKWRKSRGDQPKDAPAT